MLPLPPVLSVTSGSLWGLQRLTQPHVLYNLIRAASHLWSATVLWCTQWNFIGKLHLELSFLSSRMGPRCFYQLPVTPQAVGWTCLLCMKGKQTEGRREMRRKALVPILRSSALLPLLDGPPFQKLPRRPMGLHLQSKGATPHPDCGFLPAAPLLTTSFWKLGAISNTLDSRRLSVNGEQRALMPAATWGLARSAGWGGSICRGSWRPAPLLGTFPPRQLGCRAVGPLPQGQIMGEASPFHSPNWEVCTISHPPGVKKSLESQTDRVPASWILQSHGGRKTFTPNYPDNWRRWQWYLWRGKARQFWDHKANDPIKH